MPRPDAVSVRPVPRVITRSMVEPSPGSTAAARPWTRFALAAVFVAVALAYSNTRSVPLLLDDGPTIAGNESIRDLSRWGNVLFSGSVFTTGRPVLNLSFALNHAFGGTAVAGYHVVNALIHIGAALLLWGIVSRTFRRRRFHERLGVRSEHAALLVALLWALHPVQVASVTYLSQRAESLMGLCYLATLYGLVRGGTERTWSWWHGGAIACCAAGMGVKEVMVTAPLACFVYDVVFLSGSVRAAWQQHWRCHVGLAACWLLLAGLMAGNDFEHRVIGHAVPIPAEPYALTQVRAVAHYVRLMVWPHPLIFDYGTDQHVFETFTLGWSLVVVLATFSVAVSSWRKSRAVGFLFLWGFLVLVPTSSVVAIAGQRIAENRIYLPLAAAAVLLPLTVLAIVPRRLASAALWLLVGALGVLTWRRNHDFSSAATLWRDTVAKLPMNHRAHSWLGTALLDMPGRYGEAMSHLTEASRLGPWDVDSHWNLGRALIRDPGRLTEAIRCFEVVLKAKPQDAPAHAMLGTALLMSGTRADEAARHLEKAVQLRPERGDFHRLLGTALMNVPGRRTDAIRELETATRLAPTDAEAFTNLGIAYLAEPPNIDRAIAAQRTAVNLNPGAHLPWFNLGIALMMRGELAEAERSFERAREIAPSFEPARSKLQDLRAKRSARE